MTGGLAAVTGATGFLGQHLVRALIDDGWRVRILSRRDPISPFWAGLTPEVVPGDLADSQAVARLCRGADLVVHAAGLIGGNDTDLQRVNVDGVRQVAIAARSGHFVHVSSLVAREPALSAYAASKRAGEVAATQAFGAGATVIRPPAIYGPGDRETLRLFTLAARGPALPVLAPESRIALVHVQDAARQIVHLARARRAGTVALSDAQPQGYGWREIMQTAAQAFSRNIPLVRVPDAALYFGAATDTFANRWRGRRAVFTFGKVKELTHLDWGVPAEERAADGPMPEFGLPAGFAHTIGWYRSQGWLSA